MRGDRGDRPGRRALRPRPGGGQQAELLIALAYLDPDNGYIICNGYKDEEFVDLALQSLRLGFKCFFVLETPTELPLILEASKRLDVRPMLGIRVKLAAKVEGHWNESSGDRSIFDHGADRRAARRAARAQAADCLQLLHYHRLRIGIRDIRGAVLEACRYTCHSGRRARRWATSTSRQSRGGLRRSQTNSNKAKLPRRCCTDIIEAIMTALDPAGVAPSPDHRVGRATVAYRRSLFNILDVTAAGRIRAGGARGRARAGRTCTKCSAA
jgi:arginine decarboxylase